VIFFPKISLFDEMSDFFCIKSNFISIHDFSNTVCLRHWLVHEDHWISSWAPRKIKITGCFWPCDLIAPRTCKLNLNFPRMLKTQEIISYLRWRTNKLKKQSNQVFSWRECHHAFSIYHYLVWE
jgi:hypothetical protein